MLGFPGCKSLNGKSCDFPFKYNGTIYTQCTKDYSESGKPWCANEVDPATGAVIDEQWGDCDEGCPGTGTGSGEILVILGSMDIHKK